MVEPDSVHDLRTRLELVEARARRQSFLLQLCALLVVALPLLAWTSGNPPEELRASRFVLENSEGAERGVWEVLESGDTRLALRDATGVERLVAFSKQGDMLFVLRDGKEKTRLGLSLDARGNPHVTLLDKNQTLRLHQSVGDEGQPSMLFYDGEGGRPLGFGITAEGEVWTLPKRN